MVIHTDPSRWMSLLLVKSPPTTEWLVSESMFALVVKGSIAGLLLAIVAILLIWFQEWRKGKVW